MKQTITMKGKRKQTATLFFNLATMIASFVLALVILPQGIFFVVAVMVLFGLRYIEKDVNKSEQKKYPLSIHS